MKRLLLTLIMGFSFFGLFGQTNNFKIVDANEFEKFIKDSTVTVVELGTGFRGWVAAGKDVMKSK